MQNSGVVHGQGREAHEVKTILRQSVVEVELGAERLRIHNVPPLMEELKHKIGFKVVPQEGAEPVPNKCVVERYCARTGFGATTGFRDSAES